MLSKFHSQRETAIVEWGRGRQAKHIVAKRSQRISESLAKWAEAEAVAAPTKLDPKLDPELEL